MNFKKCLKITLIFILMMIFMTPKDVYAYKIVKNGTKAHDPKSTVYESTNTTFAKNDHHRLYFSGGSQKTTYDSDIQVFQEITKPKKIGSKNTFSYLNDNGGLPDKTAEKYGISCHPFSSRKLLWNDKTSTWEEVYCAWNEKYFESSSNWTTGKCDKDSLLNNLISGVTKNSYYEVLRETFKEIDKYDFSSVKINSNSNRSKFNRNNKYLYKTAAANYITNKTGCKYDSNGVIESLVKKAIATVKGRYAAKDKFRSGKISTAKSSDVMSRKGTTNTYISGAVTISNLVDKVYGVNTTYTFTASGSGNIYLCTKADGTGCTAANSTTIVGKTSQVYYVKVDNATANSTISLTIIGSPITITIEKSQLYCHANIDKRATQPVVRPINSTATITSKNPSTFTLKVPNNRTSTPTPTPITPTPSPGASVTPTPTPTPVYEHQIEIYKVDEYGEPITTANFKLSDQSGNTLTWDTNNSDPAIFRYTYRSNNGVDTFINKRYCFEETVSPDGFVKNKASDRNCITITNETKSVCYQQNENSDVATVEPDANYCNAVLSCPDGYTLSSDSIEWCSKTDEFEKVTDCSATGGTIYTDDTNNTTMCRKVEEATPVVDDETGEASCSIGTIESEACVSYYTPSDICSDGNPVNADGTCTRKVNAPSICTGGAGAVANSEGSDNYKYCRNMDSYSYVQLSGGDAFIVETNVRNSVSISKRAINSNNGVDGDEVEIPGASLKICSKASYQSKKFDCDAAKTIDNVEMSWVSDVVEKTFNGVPVGDYYIIETLPPSGFKTVQTATQFSIDEDGKIKTGTTEVTNNLIVIGNQLNGMSISKTDIVTTKELPGAVISICPVVKESNSTSDDEEGDSVGDGEGIPVTDEGDESGDTASSNDDDDITGSVFDLGIPVEVDMYGNCIPVKLNDGSAATWVSTDKPHEIVGLPAGEYYLVETTAPNGYSTAEAIRFIMNEDGTISDEKGNLLKDSRIVMKDKPIVEVKTGDILLLIITALGLVGLGFGSYYYFNNKEMIFNKIKRFGKANS